MPKNSKKLSILIATVFERSDHLTELFSLLVPQVHAHKDSVELLISSDDRKMPIGKKRQELVEKAQGEYICFVDDDDLVADTYVSKILPLLDGVDYIGFRLQTYINGREQKPTYHSLQYESVSDDENGYYRDISHLNPIKRSIAQQVRFSGGNKEDDRWATALRRKSIVRTEHYIDEVMYCYWFDTERSFFNGNAS